MLALNPYLTIVLCLGWLAFIAVGTLWAVRELFRRMR